MSSESILYELVLKALSIENAAKSIRALSDATIWGRVSMHLEARALVMGEQPGTQKAVPIPRGSRFGKNIRAALKKTPMPVDDFLDVVSSYGIGSMSDAMRSVGLLRSGDVSLTSYPDVITQNAVTTATARGQRQGADDGGFPGIRYRSALIETTRDNHEAAHDMVLATDDPRLNTWTPPNGHNCLCDLVPMTRQQMIEAGHWDLKLDRVIPYIPAGVRAGARPDPGFG